MRNGLWRGSRHGGVLRFPAISVKSAPQMWTPNYRAATTINPKPTRDRASLILIAPVKVAPAAPAICATRDRPPGAIARRPSGIQCGHGSHDQGLDSRGNTRAGMRSSHLLARGQPQGFKPLAPSGLDHPGPGRMMRASSLRSQQTVSSEDKIDVRDHRPVETCARRRDLGRHPAPDDPVGQLRNVEQFGRLIAGPHTRLTRPRGVKSCTTVRLSDPPS